MSWVPTASGVKPEPDVDMRMVVFLLKTPAVAVCDQFTDIAWLLDPATRPETDPLATTPASLASKTASRTSVKAPVTAALETWMDLAVKAWPTRT